MLEVAELVELAPRLERFGREIDAVALRHVPDRIRARGSLKVDMDLDLRHGVKPTEHGLRWFLLLEHVPLPSPEPAPPPQAAASRVPVM